MPTLDGSHSPGSGGPAVRYRVDYEVVGNTVNYRATLRRRRRPSSTKGSSISIRRASTPTAAVDAFMQNHIGKADWDVAP